MVIQRDPLGCYHVLWVIISSILIILIIMIMFMMISALFFLMIVLVLVRLTESGLGGFYTPKTDGFRPNIAEPTPRGVGPKIVGFATRPRDTYRHITGADGCRRMVPGNSQGIHLLLVV